MKLKDRCQSVALDWGKYRNALPTNHRDHRRRSIGAGIIDRSFGGFGVFPNVICVSLRLSSFFLAVADGLLSTGYFDAWNEWGRAERGTDTPVNCHPRCLHDRARSGSHHFRSEIGGDLPLQTIRGTGAEGIDRVRS